MEPSERAADLLAEWSERQQHGDYVDPEDVIRAHPDLERELRAGFAALDYVDLAVGRTPEAEPVPDRVGPYRIRELLGAGGMGTVYLGEDGRGAKVALKVIHPHLLQAPGYFKRFLREARVGAVIRHPNVVRTLKAGSAREGRRHIHYLVMEYVEGQTLAEMVEELERVPERLCRHIGLEIARALAAIHEKGAIHRDIKPGNVLITEDQIVKVMDLGVAGAADGAMRLSRTGAFVGSLLYAAPEQFDDEPLDGRCDLFALGIVLYEICTGVHPFQADNVAMVLRQRERDAVRRAAELNPQISPFFEEIIHTLLQRDRDRRFRTAAELAEILESGEQSAWWTERAREIRAVTMRPLRRIRVPRETAPYGRDEELRRIYSLYERVRAGEGRVLLVEGEAGIGKTRLVDEFVARLRKEGEDFHFLYGGYPPGGAATPIGAFSTAFREHLGDTGSAPHLAAASILAPAFEALLRGEPPPEGQEPLTKDSLQTVFVHVTASLAAERPTLIAIDDLHFAPRDGLALFMALALAIPDHGVLLVGTSRPGLPAGWAANAERLPHAVRMELGRLSPKDLIHLLKEAFRSEHLAHELGGKIAEKSDGNPFFVFEIVRGLKEGQFLRQRADGTWVTEELIRNVEVPSSVTDLVRARLEDATPEEHGLLEVAACCGHRFDPALVAEVVGLQSIPALQALGRIERRLRLIRSAGRMFVFDHHQVQEALYAGMSEPLRERYHAALGAALEHGFDGTERQPEEVVALADHYLRGGQGSRALPYLDAAVDHLEQTHNSDAALALANRALAAPGLLVGKRRVEVLLRKAGRLELFGDREAQQQALHEAFATAGDDRRLALDVHRASARLKVRVADYTGARLEAEHLCELSREVGERSGEAAAMNILGMVCWSLGKYAEARKHHERQRILAQSVGDRMVEQNALQNLGLVLWSLGSFGEATRSFEDSKDLAVQVGSRFGESSAIGNLGLVLLDQGRFEEAKERFERHRELARLMGDRLGEAHATGNLGLVCMALGLGGDAADLAERDLALCRALGNREGQVIATALAGIALGEMGDLGEARRLHGSAADLAAEIGTRMPGAITRNELARVEWYAGDHERAREHARASVEMHASVGRTPPLADALAMLGLLSAAEDPARARELFREVAALAGEFRLRDCGLRAKAYLLSLGEGELQDVLDALAKHESACWHRTRMELRILLWKLTGDRAHLDRAHEILVRLRDHARPHLRRAIVENIAHHREIAHARMATPPDPL